jgi:hypothetical protein
VELRQADVRHCEDVAREGEIAAPVEHWAEPSVMDGIRSGSDFVVQPI